MTRKAAERIETRDVAIKTPSLTLIMLPACKQQREALAKSVCTTAMSRTFLIAGEFSARRSSRMHRGAIHLFICICTHIPIFYLCIRALQRKSGFSLLEHEIMALGLQQERETERTERGKRGGGERGAVALQCCIWICGMQVYLRPRSLKQTSSTFHVVWG